ncbi:MAG: hypothetical protein V1793_10620 [Pseudomonadota bacterium]
MILAGLKCRHCVVLVAALLLLVIPGAGYCYVLQGSHILELMTKTINEPKGIIVHQRREILPREGEKAFTGSILETVWLKPTGSFRSEIVSGEQKRLTVYSEGNSITVLGGRRIAAQASPTDRYLDILLFRSRQRLEQKLTESGVDIGVSSLKRFNSAICFVVGNVNDAQHPSSSSLWVDKETFLPVRYFVVMNGRQVDIGYQNWQKVSASWYPREISISMNQEPGFLIHVDTIEIGSQFPGSFFDVDTLRVMYPEAAEPPISTAEPDGVNDIQKSIRDFVRLYE